MGIETVLTLLDCTHSVIQIPDVHFGHLVALLLLAVGDIELIVFHYYLVVLVVYLVVHSKQAFQLIIVMNDIVL